MFFEPRSRWTSDEDEGYSGDDDSDGFDEQDEDTYTIDNTSNISEDDAYSSDDPAFFNIICSDDALCPNQKQAPSAKKNLNFSPPPEEELDISSLQLS